MLRDMVRVRMTKEQFLSLGVALAMLPPGEARDELATLHEQATRDFQDIPEEGLLEQARSGTYNGEKDDLEVDEDAPLSRLNEPDFAGVWVGAWVFIRRKPATDLMELCLGGLDEATEVSDLVYKVEGYTVTLKEVERGGRRGGKPHRILQTILDNIAYEVTNINHGHDVATFEWEWRHWELRVS